MRARRVPRRLFLIAFALTLGCEHASGDLCEATGLCDETTARPPEEYVVLADASPGSVANHATVDAVLDAIFERALERPGSVIAIRVVGEDAQDSREIASVEVPERPRRLRSPRAYGERIARELRQTLLAQLTAELEASSEQRRSAIAEAMTLAGREPRRAAARYVVVLSDLRQSTRPWLDLECPRRLPAARRFERLLDRRGLLSPGTFGGGDTIILLDHGLPPFPRRRRCPSSIRRADELRELWVGALHRAGAERVRTLGRVPTFEDLATTDAPEGR